MPVRPLRHRRRRATSLPPGPAIIVANHRSYFDSAAMAMAIARAVAPFASSARRRCSTRRSIGQLAKAMGGIRVDRGTGSDEPLQAAAEALADGEVVAIMPQGTIPRGRRSSTPC